jgi:hypothetical protein
MKHHIKQWLQHFKFCRNHTGIIEAVKVATTVVYRLHKADQLIRQADAKK